MKSVTFKIQEDGKVQMVETLKVGDGPKHVETDTHDYELVDRVGVREFVSDRLKTFLLDTNLPEKVPGLFDGETVSTPETPEKNTVTLKKKKKKS